MKWIFFVWGWGGESFWTMVQGEGTLAFPGHSACSKGCPLGLNYSSFRVKQTFHAQATVTNSLYHRAKLRWDGHVRGSNRTAKTILNWGKAGFDCGPGLAALLFLVLEWGSISDWEWLGEQAWKQRERRDPKFPGVPVILSRTHSPIMTSIFFLLDSISQRFSAPPHTACN